jgi:hypothetical protein
MTSPEAATEPTGPRTGRRRRGPRKGDLKEAAFSDTTGQRTHGRTAESFVVSSVLTYVETAINIRRPDDANEKVLNQQRTTPIGQAGVTVRSQCHSDIAPLPVDFRPYSIAWCPIGLMSKRRPAARTEAGVEGVRHELSRCRVLAAKVLTTDGRERTPVDIHVSDSTNSIARSSCNLLNEISRPLQNGVGCTLVEDHAQVPNSRHL